MYPPPPQFCPQAGAGAPLVPYMDGSSQVGNTFYSDPSMHVNHMCMTSAMCPMGELSNSCVRFDTQGHYAYPVQEFSSNLQSGNALSLDDLKGNVLRLAKDDRGTWLVQAALEDTATSEVERVALAKELR